MREWLNSIAGYPVELWAQQWYQQRTCLGSHLLLAASTVWWGMMVPEIKPRHERNPVFVPYWQDNRSWNFKTFLDCFQHRKQKWKHRQKGVENATVNVPIKWSTFRLLAIALTDPKSQSTTTEHPAVLQVVLAFVCFNSGVILVETKHSRIAQAAASLRSGVVDPWCGLV